MKNQALNAIIAGALGLASAQAMAGWVALPTSGSSAYTLCNTTGNWGSTTFSVPSPGSNDTCAIFSAPSASGFSNKASQTRNLVVNGVTVGTAQDQVWFNNTTKEYIFALRINMTENPYDYDEEEDEDMFFEINDTVRTGFSGKTLSISYRYDTSTSDEVLYRAGLTSTSVMAPPVGAALPSTTDAPFDSNAVDFTTDVNNEDPDGSSPKDSSWLYVKYTGAGNDNGSHYTTGTNTLKFRQMGQEAQPYMEITVDSFVPN